mmetsp:Transcript_1006/g.1967  ORF Transcript_1006/g.1967 Transcript_1006/m.1967 type:complete len:225 (+) Transcript_1006:91-765(+)
MMATFVGLSEIMALSILGCMLLVAAPLPRGVTSSVLSVRPGWILCVASAATSIVPFAEHAKALYEYRPRGNGDTAAYETDPRFLVHHVGLLRALMVGILLFAFTLLAFVAGNMVAAQAATERMEKNLFATKKQAMAASDQSLKMLGELDTMKKGKDKEEAASQLEAALSQNVSLQTRAEAAEKEVSIIKAQAKAFEREHEKLLDQIARLENAASEKPQEAKKDK